jgi:protocatechuate 3,4-dioxygenase beta subunit
MLWSRRQILTMSAATLAVACAPVGPDDGTGDGTDGGDNDEEGGDDEGGGEGEAPLVDWASIGTAAMVSAASYRDPFVNDAGAACTSTAELTRGPCFAVSPERQDISEGLPGVPVRLLLRVLDAGCAPVPGAVVDVWHCGADGLYTGDDAVPACRQGDDGAAARRTFRGTQHSDGDGRVAFDTCYPGWYPGRAVHIHVQVKSDAGDVATQLFFDEGLTADILGRVKGYAERGPPDTDHDDDLLAAADDPDSFMMQSEPTVDGAVLAWATITVTLR